VSRGGKFSPSDSGTLSACVALLSETLERACVVTRYLGSVVLSHIIAAFVSCINGDHQIHELKRSGILIVTGDTDKMEP
jgi:hypothetical protein